MSDLTARELELVALGAAIGSNCVPCVEYHIPQLRRAGVTDPEIHAAILQADKIRQAPARKTLQTALRLVASPADNARDPATAEACGCGSTADVATQGTTEAPQHREMAGMLSKMMGACGKRTQSGGASEGSETKPAVHAVGNEGCRCG